MSRTKRSDAGRKPREAETVTTSSASEDCPREQMIAEAAYFHAERRGFAPTNEMSDWLRAEVDIEGLARDRS